MDTPNYFTLPCMLSVLCMKLPLLLLSLFQGFYPPHTASTSASPSNYHKKQKKKSRSSKVKHIAKHQAFVAPPSSGDTSVAEGEEAIELTDASDG